MVSPLLAKFRVDRFVMRLHPSCPTAKTIDSHPSQKGIVLHVVCATVPPDNSSEAETPEVDGV